MKFRWFFGRSRSERELADELQFHLEAEFQNNLAAGMTEKEAWRQAGLAFGAMESVKEECRELSLSPLFLIKARVR